MEIEAWLVDKAEARADALGVRELVSIHCADITQLNEQVCIHYSLLLDATQCLLLLGSRY